MDSKDGLLVFGSLYILNALASIFKTCSLILYTCVMQKGFARINVFLTSFSADFLLYKCNGLLIQLHVLLLHAFGHTMQVQVLKASKGI